MIWPPLISQNLKGARGNIRDRRISLALAACCAGAGRARPCCACLGKQDHDPVHAESAPLAHAKARLPSIADVLTFEGRASLDRF